ncbi:hypothetical protein JXA88_00520 [Candidatus Fermentibacteria bacterium]|nr:hypothetical protein [Candidatus Fermentibacteria bacterium]
MDRGERDRGESQEQLTGRYAQLQRELAQIGYVCSGSVMQLYRTCGKPGCGCRVDPRLRHGPYYIWTRKENGKTVTRSLSKEHAERCAEYILNRRKMEKIVEEMKVVSTQIVEAGR